MELVKYDAACRAVAELKTIDECKEFANYAEAARAYARQAQNRQLEIDACEVRVRAERRLGQILLELKKGGHIARQGLRDQTAHGQRKIPRLAELGVDHNTSAIAQRLALLPEARFISEIADWRQAAPQSPKA